MQLEGTVYEIEAFGGLYFHVHRMFFSSQIWDFREEVIPLTYLPVKNGTPKQFYLKSRHLRILRYINFFFSRKYKKKNSPKVFWLPQIRWWSQVCPRLSCFGESPRFLEIFASCGARFIFLAPDSLSSRDSLLRISHRKWGKSSLVHLSFGKFASK